MASPAPYLIPPERHGEPGFLLRSYQPGDGAQVYDAVTSSHEHLKTFMAWTREEHSLERSEQRCREFRAKWLNAQDFLIGIWAPDEARFLGGCGYHLREGGLEVCNAEIGMWIRADAAGRGLGTAVLRALVLWGFTEWPWLRLSWRCSSANRASQRTAEKGGLQREGVLRRHAFDPDGQRRDTCCYAILREEWELTRPRSGL